MNFSSIEEFIFFINKIKKSNNIIIGIEETGLHEIYKFRDKENIYDILMKFIEIKNISSILYVGEDLNIKDFELKIKNTIFKDFRDIFFRKAINLNIPVKFGSFKFDKKIEMEFDLYSKIEIPNLKENSFFKKNKFDFLKK